jgi:hypothetical protein
MDLSGNGKKIIGTVLIAGLLFITTTGFYSTCTSRTALHEQQMEGAVREGTPEFEALTRKIVIQTDENNTMQSPTGMGTIVMMIAGKIRNFSGKTLTGLEIKVTVVDQLGKPVKEKVLTVIPSQQDKLEANETMPVRVMIEGFSKDDDRAMIRWKVTAIKTSD